MRRIPVREVHALSETVRACTHCAELPLGPKPIFQLHPAARILVVGQAPGRKAHEKGVPFDDPSGDRLRDWLGVTREVFYNPRCFALLPMGFCYPGTGSGGDLPPSPECAPRWRAQVLACLPGVELTIVLGRYALDYHLPESRGQSISEIVTAWRDYWPQRLPMPHPSPRNIRWVKAHPFFLQDTVPALRARVAELLG